MKNIYIYLFSLFILACGNSEKSSESNLKSSETTNYIKISKQQFESQNMRFGQLIEQSFNTTVKANGAIDVPPENRSSVNTFIGGYVNKVPLLVGDKVKKGQFVASLSSTDIVEIQQEYLEVLAQLAYQKNEYTRQKTLFEEKISSQKNYLKAESVYKSSLAMYNGLRKKLQMLNIEASSVEQGEITSEIKLYAPIDGYVTKVNVSNGAFVSPSSKLLEIVNTDHIHLELDVFEKDILNVKRHQKIVFHVPEASNKNFQGEVHLVGTSIDNNRIIKVHGHLNDDQIQLITGMFVEASIIVESKKGISIAKTAILKNELNSYLLVLKEEKNDTYFLEKLPLKIGLENEKFAEVLNCSSFKDKKIVTQGVFMLNEL